MGQKKKNAVQDLKYERRSAWEKADEQEAYRLAEQYIHFLNAAKTEWEVIDFVRKHLDNNGFSPAQGPKRYYIHADRMLIAAANISKKPEYLKIIIAHIDSPRIDLKQNPLYEEMGLSFFKTHYYGGLKKYHWLNIPLELHGRVFLKGGKEQRIVIGASPEEPCFVISDLLPHLSRKIVDNKKVSDAFLGEKLRILVGNQPLPSGQNKEEKEKDRVKLNVLKILHERYGIKERDLLVAEFEAVPNFSARFVGLDRSMIGGYGQDDRISAYSALQAFLEAEKSKDIVLILVDKEEIGSDGNTGAKSKVIRNVLKSFYPAVDIDLLLMQSKALSADVNSAVDPNYKEAFEPDNNSLLGYGLVVTKVTGSGGKYSASEADARFLAAVTELFDKHKVAWQVGEIGKVDEGGGGTVAKYIAEYGLDILDAGPALLGMHSPFEISSVADLYMAKQGYRVFYEFI